MFLQAPLTKEAGESAALCCEEHTRKGYKPVKPGVLKSMYGFP